MFFPTNSRELLDRKDIHPESTLGHTPPTAFHFNFTHAVLAFCLKELTTGDLGTTLGTDCPPPHWHLGGPKILKALSWALRVYLLQSSKPL